MKKEVQIIPPPTPAQQAPAFFRLSKFNATLQKAQDEEASFFPRDSLKYEEHLFFENLPYIFEEIKSCYHNIFTMEGETF